MSRAAQSAVVFRLGRCCGSRAHWASSGASCWCWVSAAARCARAAPRWSASITWLLARLVRDLPAFAFAELRYRDRNWRAIGESMLDAREALAALPASSPIALLGFSMGGGVAIGAAGDARVRGVVGSLRGCPTRSRPNPCAASGSLIVHGSRDRALPLLPGVHPAHSHRLLQRAAAAGAHTKPHHDRRRDPRDRRAHAVRAPPASARARLERGRRRAPARDRGRDGSDRKIGV